MRHVVIGIATQLASAAFALLLIRTYTHHLDIERVGQLMLALGGIAIFDATVTMAVCQTVFRMASNRFRREFFVRAISRAEKVQIPLGLVLAAVAVTLIITAPPHNIQLQVAAGIISVICYICCEPLRSLRFNLLLANESRGIIAFAVVVEGMATLSAVHTLLTWAPGVGSALAGMALSRLVSQLTARILIERYWLPRSSNYKMKGNGSRKTICVVARKSISVSAMGLLGWTGNYLDRFVLAFTLGTASAGTYAIATGLSARPFNVITGALAQAFRPNLYRAVRLGHTQRSTGVALRWLGSAGLTSAVITVALWQHQDAIVEILVGGESASGVADIITALAAAYGMSICCHALDNYLLASGSDKTLLSLQATLLPIQLLTLAVLSVLFGIYGACAAKLLGELVKLVATAWICRLNHFRNSSHA